MLAFTILRFIKQVPFTANNGALVSGYLHCIVFANYNIEIIFSFDFSQKLITTSSPKERMQEKHEKRKQIKLE